MTYAPQKARDDCHMEFVLYERGKYCDEHSQYVSFDDWRKEYCSKEPSN